MMSKMVLLLASMFLTMVLVSGIAWAVTRNCEAGADFCVGTNQDDTLNGSDVRDRIYGKDGDDHMLGNDGNDGFSGGRGADTISGGDGLDNLNESGGADRLYGGGGDDDLTDLSFNNGVDDKNRLYGGGGDDELIGQVKLYGGSGDDTLEAGGFDSTPTTLDGGAGLDRIFGSGSPDTVFAQDGERDTVTCGGNRDIVYFDAGIDSVNPANCERRISTPQ
jgi:Ca2+-binding RTX toxin-like protein